jgi:type IV pilus assembly protein PilY1
LKGNVWRFDLTSSSPGSWAVQSTPIYTTSSGQPITSKLIVASVPATPNARVLVEFGTGQQVPFTTTSAATYSQQQQYLYGVWDWNMTGWNAKLSTQYATMPVSTGAVSGITKLVQQTITSYSGTTDYRTLSSNTICWAGITTTGCSTNNNYGWYLALTTGYANSADVNLPSATQSTTKPTPAVYEQVIYSPVLADGAFVVNTTIPATGSLATCSTTAAGGWTMGIDPASGGSIPFFSSSNISNTTTSNISGLGLSASGSVSTVNSGNNVYVLLQTPPPANCTANCSGNGITVKQVIPNAATGGNRLTWIQRR